MSGLTLRALQLAWQASTTPAARRFERALASPAAAQGTRLRRILRAAAASDYGRRHGLDRVDSVTAYQDRVPVADADTLAAWVARVAAGERHVLTTAPTLMLERSSGSSAAAKLIPYTAALREELSSATSAWLHDLYARHPTLRGTRSYWSVSPATRAAERTVGGLRVGFDDDTEYFGRAERLVLRHMLAVAPEVARLRDVEAWRRRTCLDLLAASDLGVVSVWSPSFLTLLMEAIARDWDALLDALPAPRRAELRRAIPLGAEPLGHLLWPRLALLSCWTDGPAKDQLAALRRWFPATPLQAKGLLATEGVVSIPWGPADDGEAGAVLAVTAHFLELIDLDRPSARPLLAHELRVGGSYSPLLTTGGGFHRYHLKDVLRCVGHEGATPRVRFEGRLDGASDRAGEKLSAHHVGRALTEACAEAGLAPTFALVAPVLDPPAYRLYVETDAAPAVLDRAVAALEARLRDNPHYDHCRRLGQLGPLEAVPVRNAWAAFVARKTRGGARAGDVKPTPLDPHPGWDDAFERAPALARPA